MDKVIERYNLSSRNHIKYMDIQITNNGIETVFYKFQQTKVQNQMVSPLEPDGFTKKS